MTLHHLNSKHSIILTKFIVLTTIFFILDDYPSISYLSLISYISFLSLLIQLSTHAIFINCSLKFSLNLISLHPYSKLISLSDHLYASLLTKLHYSKSSCASIMTYFKFRYLAHSYNIQSSNWLVEFVSLTFYSILSQDDIIAQND